VSIVHLLKEANCSKGATPIINRCSVHAESFMQAYLHWEQLSLSRLITVFCHIARHAECMRKLPYLHAIRTTCASMAGSATTTKCTSAGLAAHPGSVEETTSQLVCS
jgi:hypothetical protein